MISDLACLYCHKPAFAVLNVEIAQGRARWPTCQGMACMHRAVGDAGVRLAHAASQANVTHPNAIDVDVVELTTGDDTSD